MILENESTNLSAAEWLGPDLALSAAELTFASLGQPVALKAPLSQERPTTGTLFFILNFDRPPRQGLGWSQIFNTLLTSRGVALHLTHHLNNTVKVVEKRKRETQVSSDELDKNRKSDGLQGQHVLDSHFTVYVSRRPRDDNLGVSCFECEFFFSSPSMIIILGFSTLL